MKYPPTMKYYHLTTTMPQLFIFCSQIICWAKVHRIECLLEKDRKLKNKDNYNGLPRTRDSGTS